MMSAPASAKPIATAWPIPRVPPVIRAVWPSREKNEAAIVKLLGTRVTSVVINRGWCFVQFNEGQFPAWGMTLLMIEGSSSAPVESSQAKIGAESVPVLSREN